MFSARYAHEQLCFHAWGAQRSESCPLRWKRIQVLSVPVHRLQWMVGDWKVSMERCRQTFWLHL